jgi:hypothetical protein
MNTSKKEVICQLINFMMEKYYNVIEEITKNNSIPNAEFLIEQLFSVLHTAILAHKNAIPSN